jgi:hypothetical protein
MKRKMLAISRGAVLALPALAALMAPARADEADARALLKAMSDYLVAQDSFSFDYDSMLDVVTSDGETLSLASSGSVAVDRPGMIRASRKGGFVDLDMVFDGKNLSLYGGYVNRYVSVELPGTIDDLTTTLRDTYHHSLPAADLLGSDPYDVLMSDVTEVKDLGSGVIGGEECDFFAFRNDQVDWQIWISQGQEPYPCRFSITTRDVANAPQYSVTIRNWQIGTNGADFTFRAPVGAEAVDAAEFTTLVPEMPAHFSLGELK